jgi:hypothetical protein
LNPSSGGLQKDKNPALNKDGVFICEKETGRNLSLAGGPDRFKPQRFRQHKLRVP